MRIFRGAGKQMERVTLPDSKLAVQVLVMVFLEVFYNFLWAIIDPLGPVETPYPSDTFLTYTSCSSPNSTIWTIVSFVYKGLFLIYGVFLATMTKGVPGAFNESRLLALSLYNSTFCILVGVPLTYILTDLNAIFVVKSLVILYVTMFTILTIFCPRLYYIYVPPPDHFFQTSYQAKLSRSPSDRGPAATPPASIRLNNPNSNTHGGGRTSPNSPSRDRDSHRGSQVDTGSVHGSTGDGSDAAFVYDKQQEHVKPAMEMVTGGANPV